MCVRVCLTDCVCGGGDKIVESTVSIWVRKHVAITMYRELMLQTVVNTPGEDGLPVHLPHCNYLNDAIT